MSMYYPLRRIPESFPTSYLWRKVMPLAGPLIKSSFLTFLAEAVPENSSAKEILQESARAQGDAALEKMQRKYFDYPGLDTLTVRQTTKIGRAIGRAGRIYLWTRLAAGIDKDGRARHNLALIPRTGYDIVMLTGLAVGTALGYFSGGKVSSHCWWDSETEQKEIPEGHTIPAIRRYQPPETLGDLAADIDDLYWAEAYGQAVKVTRVGEGQNRRWLVSLPGTDHSEPDSQPNQADLESNLREELNLPSAMRVGVAQIIHHAMSLEGIPRPERMNEKVLICGHSQGGMIAVALSAMSPDELGFAVDAVITLGSPARRIKVRPEVTVLAVEHDQDIVPSLDGTPRKEADQRVVYHRRLVRPRQGALFYAHASSTYTETVRQMERQMDVAPWGKMGGAVAKLRKYLPEPGETTRVTHHYTWQEILTPVKGKAWDQFLAIERPDWNPVSFEGEIEVEQNIPTTPRELIDRAEELIDRAGGLLRGSMTQDPGKNQDTHDLADSDSEEKPNLEVESKEATTTNGVSDEQAK